VKKHLDDGAQAANSRGERGTRNSRKHKGLNTFPGSPTRNRKYSRKFREAPCWPIKGESFIQKKQARPDGDPSQLGEAMGEKNRTGPLRNGNDLPGRNKVLLERSRTAHGLWRFRYGPSSLTAKEKQPKNKRKAFKGSSLRLF